MKRNGGAFYLTGRIILICLGLLFLGLAGCITSPGKTSTAMTGTQTGEHPSEIQREESGETPEDKSTQSFTNAQIPSIQDRWGIEIVAIRLSAAGHMMDFRYRVVDPDKAIPILDFKIKPYLIDQKSGAKFEVPTTAKVGSLRQTTRSGKPQVNRVYFVLFGNPGRSVKAGDKVTVVIGEFRAEDLTVQ